MNEFDKEKLIEKDIKSIENRVRHAFNQGYEAGLKHGKEQEPKIGHWIDGHCDCCGKAMAFHIGRCGGNAYTEMFYSDYCPNCGVKMESEEK